MLRKRLVVVGLVSAGLLAIVLAGCRRDSSASREEFSGVMATDSGREFIPIKLPDRKGDAILGAMAAGAEQPSATEGGEAAEEMQIDDSSAEAVGNTIVQMAAANDWARLPELLVTEQAEAVTPILDDLLPFVTAVTEFQKTLNGKFESHAVVIDVPDAWLQQMVTLANELQFEVESAGDQEARLVFIAGQPDSPATRQIEMTARRTDDGWRLAFEGAQPPADTASLDLQKKTQDFRDLANRLLAEDVQDAAMVKAETDKVIAGTYEPAAAEDQDSAEQLEAEARPEPAAQPRQREAVDDVYSGPGMLRGR